MVTHARDIWADFLNANKEYRKQRRAERAAADSLTSSSHATSPQLEDYERVLQPPCSASDLMDVVELNRRLLEGARAKHLNHFSSDFSKSKHRRSESCPPVVRQEPSNLRRSSRNRAISARAKDAELSHALMDIAIADAEFRKENSAIPADQVAAIRFYAQRRSEEERNRLSSTKLLEASKDVWFNAYQLSHHQQSAPESFVSFYKTYGAAKCFKQMTIC